MTNTPLDIREIPFYKNWGLWEVDSIDAIITSDKTGVIIYKQRVRNAHTYRVMIYLRPWDRWRGITLDSKITKKYNKIKSELQRLNNEILMLEARNKNFIEKLK